MHRQEMLCEGVGGYGYPVVTHVRSCFLVSGEVVEADCDECDSGEECGVVVVVGVFGVVGGFFFDVLAGHVFSFLGCLCAHACGLE